jgi:hypothetical protein
MAPPASIQPAVQKYFEQHTGTTVYVDDMSAALDLERKQIQVAVTGLIRKGTPIEVVHSGNTWRYGPKQSSKSVYEEIGTARDGRVVLQREDGTLWVATQL